MSNGNLGRLEKVDVRDVWQNEAGDFTPWLAQDENLKLLGDTIEIELELEATERSVGPFRADILCKDASTGAWVLIENQLERTDHIHLGQILTYAAGLKAATIVWIASQFTEEHRAALDWLNEATGEKFNFFGLEVELWKIADSQIAPKFNLTCKPNDWTKNVIIDTGMLSETQMLQLRYWTALREHLLELNATVKPRKPSPQNWTDFAVGGANFNLLASVNTQTQVITVGLACFGPNGKAHFHLLKEDSEAIEQAVGSKLEWLELPNKKASRILLRKDIADPRDENHWPNQHQWLATTLEAFHSTFSERLKTLDASDYQLDDPDGE